MMREGRFSKLQDMENSIHDPMTVLYLGTPDD